MITYATTHLNSYRLSEDLTVNVSINDMMILQQVDFFMYNWHVCIYFNDLDVFIIITNTEPCSLNTGLAGST